MTDARELLDAYANETCTHLAVSGDFDREGFAPKAFAALCTVLENVEFAEQRGRTVIPTAVIRRAITIELERK